MHKGLSENSNMSFVWLILMRGRIKAKICFLRCQPEMLMDRLCKRSVAAVTGQISIYTLAHYPESALQTRTNVPVYQRTGVPVYQCTSVPVYQCTRREALRGRRARADTRSQSECLLRQVQVCGQDFEEVPTPEPEKVAP